MSIIILWLVRKILLNCLPEPTCFYWHIIVNTKILKTEYLSDIWRRCYKCLFVTCVFCCISSVLLEQQARNLSLGWLNTWNTARYLTSAAGTLMLELPLDKRRSHERSPWRIYQEHSSVSFVFGFLRLPGLLTMHSAFSKRQLLHQSATIKNEGKKVLRKVNKETLLFMMQCSI